VVGAATRGAVGWVATLVRVLGLLIAAILVIHILYTVFAVNPVNAVATFVRDGAKTFSLGLAGLFTPPNQKLAVGVNYGIAAVIWLTITSVVVGLVRRVS
jgi:hypothetical protein